MSSDGTTNEQAKLKEVPGREVSGSEMQSEDRIANPVLDFLYHDARRIASFLAQFETYGVLQSVKAIESVSHRAGKTTKFAATGSVPALAKGEASRETSVADEEGDAAERTYDPLWRNGLTLYRYLESEGLIHDGIADAHMGQFVLVQGDLMIRPASLMAALWSAEGVREAVIEKQAQKALSALPMMPGKKGYQARQNRQLISQSSRRTTAAAMDILASFPHTMQLVLKLDGGERIWCNLSAEFLSVTGADLALTHGSHVMGRWSVLGILDAPPSEIPPDEPSDPEEAWDAEKMMRNLANGARRIAGRPADAHAMTPLLVFRQI